MSSDFKLDADGDLDMTGGDLQRQTGLELQAALLKATLQMLEGEWFLNLDLGLPRYESILVKNPNLSVIEAIFREKILGSPGIVAINSISLDYDRAARTLAVEANVQGTDGDFTVSIP